MIAAIYARKSTDQNGVADEQKSVARQVAHARQYAERKGWRVDDACIFVDDGISGAEFTNRPGFLRLMNSLKPQPPFQTLIASEESRLGREQLEVGFALKQIITAGVRVYFYLADTERTLDTPIDKIMLSLTAFADEFEREKARQRTRDAMVRKAQAGHVCGGSCFGYRNIEIGGADGRRSHVDREIDADQAEVIRRIFLLSAQGHGTKAIAKILNGEAALSPRAQLGRSRSWAPTSVREVLFRELYRGEMVWAQTAKRDRWGQKRQTGRPASDWIRRPVPHLRIVSDELWAAAHARLSAARAIYLKGTNGRPFGRPALGSASKYLLSNISACGCCGGSLRARSRSHGKARAFFYGCSNYHERGRSVCSNNADVPMTDADYIVTEALLDDVLDESMVSDAIEEALCLLAGDSDEDRLERLDAELAAVSRERDRLVAAIASGGQLAGLMSALQERETRRGSLEAERDALRARRRLQTSEIDRVRGDLTEIAAESRRVLAEDQGHARPIVTSLLVGRVAFTPTEPKRWIVKGEGTLAGLFSREFSVGMASPTGFEPVFWP